MILEVGRTGRGSTHFEPVGHDDLLEAFVLEASTKSRSFDVKPFRSPIPLRHGHPALPCRANGTREARPPFHCAGPVPPLENARAADLRRAVDGTTPTPTRTSASTVSASP